MEHVYCYQLGSTNCYKVGRTKNSPATRKLGLATGAPMRLTLYKDIETEYSSALETHIHQLLDPKRAENGEYFHVTPGELDSAVDQAVSFVERAQPLLQKAADLRSRAILSEAVVEPSDEMLQTYHRLRALRQQRYLLQQEIDFLESTIQVAIGENSGMRGVASWKWVDCPRFDEKRFKKEQETLYSAYLRDSGSRRFCVERAYLADADSAG